MAHDGGAVDLYWIPLGAGAHVVRVSGRLFEAASARLQRRAPSDLYHSALEVFVPEGRYILEMTPIPAHPTEDRGVVAEGPVGLRAAGRLRLFRYEIRRWREGLIPDAGEAVDSPVRLADDVALARRVLELAPQVPPLTWGRDEAHVGDMWNSNSVVSWLLSRAGFDTTPISPPHGGRAPGWFAGLALAQAAGDPADSTALSGGRPVPAEPPSGRPPVPFATRHR